MDGISRNRVGWEARTLASFLQVFLTLERSHFPHLCFKQPPSHGGCLSLQHSTLFFRWGFSPNLELSSAVSWTGWSAKPRGFSLPLQHWNYRHALPCPAFTRMLRTRLRPPCLCSRHFAHRGNIIDKVLWFLCHLN